MNRQQAEPVDSVLNVCLCLRDMNDLLSAVRVEKFELPPTDFIKCIIRRFTQFALSLSLSLSPLSGTETWFLRRLQGRSSAQSAL